MQKYLELTAEAHQVREVVSSIVHVILFTRLLHNPHPVTTHTATISTTSATTSYSYCKLQDADVEKQVDTLCQQLITNDAEKTVSVIILRRDAKRQHGWLMMRPRGPAEAEVLERWTINIKIGRSLQPDLLAKAVQESLIYIASSVGGEEAMDVEGIMFRLEVVGGSESLAAMFKRMLSDSNIPPLLG